MKIFQPLAAVLIAVFFTQSLCAQSSKGAKPGFIEGPATAKLGKVAQIEVPAGYTFVDGKTINAFMKSAGQPVDDGLLGSIDPTNSDWSVLFSYSEIGYVKDDEKDKLNADKLLQSYKDGTEQANKYRAKSGIPPIHVVGWEQPPKYNETTHNLEWAIRGTSEGRDILNYDTRILGRKGVMEVKLIVEPDQFRATLSTFTNLMAGYQYETGQSYAEYKPGDKIAKYGLGALVVGGAAVGAAKLGLLGPVILFFKKGFKLIIVGVVAVAALFKKFFGRLFGRKDD